MKHLSRRRFVQMGMSGMGGVLLAGTGVRSLVPVFGEDNVFNIMDYGARAGGEKLNTAAIQKAVDACARKGGGKVVVPGGTFLSGSIYLKSNVNLYLDNGAILLSSPYFKDFPEHLPRKDVRYQKYLKRALIYAQAEHDISVSGPGILDGNAKLDGSGEFKEKISDNPSFIWFDECENVTVKDITYRRSVWWTQAYSQCRNVHVDHITVTENYFYNADGCDIVDCEDFIVENCDINADDDGICMKGYTSNGCRRGVIRNNKVRSLCNGIKMGTDSSGGFRDILIENNEVWQTGISGLALQIVDGGVMENITARNTTMNGIGTPITLRLGDRNRLVRGELTVQPGIMRNILISGVKATVNRAQKNEIETKHHDISPYTSSICGIPDNLIQDVRLENIDITVLGGFEPVSAEAVLQEIPEKGNKYPESNMFGTLPSYGFYVRHARGVSMNNISVTIQQKDGRPAFLLDDVHDSTFERISVSSPSKTPAFTTGPNCSGIQLNP